MLKVDTNWTITPNLINEGGFGFTRYTSGESDSFNGLAWTNAQGWPGLQNLFYNGIPEMDFNNIQSLNADRLTGLNKSYTYEYSDMLIWTKGSHTFKFGTDIQTLEAITPLGFNGSDNYGTYQFNTSGSAGMFTGVDFADFLLGIPYQTFYDVVKQDNDGLSQPLPLLCAGRVASVTRSSRSPMACATNCTPATTTSTATSATSIPASPAAGRVIYPQGKQALLAQGFLASANACDPDGVTNNQHRHHQRRALHASRRQQHGRLPRQA